MRSGLPLPGFLLWIGVARVGAVVLVLGCNTRDRLTFPNPGPAGSGPQTIIDRPLADTTVTAGPGFIVTGFTRDPDGVDTVYFETEGGVTTFPPFVHGDDSVRFALPLTTSGQSGQTITLRVFGTDRLGNRGDTATRQITVQ
jgi:hypothetical protein